jgi:aspartate aminotransferase-like enzyme
MVSVNAGPSFSVARRLPDANILASLARPLEVRLLAIEPPHRRRAILAGLLWQVYDFARANEFSDLLISAIARRESMYRKLGFRVLGPAVPDAAAWFIPMVKSMNEDAAADRDRARSYRRHWLPTRQAAGVISFLPGPVPIHCKVSEAFATIPVSHRSEPFIQIFERARSLLRELVPGAEAVILPGSGTLANDAVAANLKAVFGCEAGLIVSNGEFGERLAGHAFAAGLRFRHLRFDWGLPWDFKAIHDAFAHKPAWVWAVQIETSTGVLNNTELLLATANDADCAVALDCVSSIGAICIAAECARIFFATGVSGKSIGAYAGLAFVYASDECRERLTGKPVPRTFDLVAGCRTPGPTMTIASSPVCALTAALELYYGTHRAIEQRFEHYRSLGCLTRNLMTATGIGPLAGDEIAAPNIHTFVLPGSGFIQKCVKAGYQIAYESTYLRTRGWGQIATMGDVTSTNVECLFRNLNETRL